MFMLAKVYKPAYFRGKSWIVTEKYDGVRCAIKKEATGFEFMLRSGKPYYSKYLEQHLDIPERIWFDGELRAEGSTRVEQRYNAIAAINSLDDRPLYFTCFDIIEPNMRAIDRRNFIDKLEITGPIKGVITREDQAKELLEDAIAEDQEGIMLLDIDSFYQEKRTSSLLKMKPVLELEAICEGITEGEGRLKGMVGALNLSIDGVKFKAAGMTDEVRKVWFEKPPIGARIKLKANEISQYGVPIAPRIVKVVLA